MSSTITFLLQYDYTPLIRATYLKFSRIVYYFVQIKKMDITFYEMVC